MLIFPKLNRIITRKSDSDKGLSPKLSWKMDSPTTPETRILSDFYSVGRTAYQNYTNNDISKGLLKEIRLHDACKEVIQNTDIRNIPETNDNTTLPTYEVPFQWDKNGANAKSVDEFMWLKLKIDILERYYGSESISQVEKEEIERSLKLHRKIIEDLHVNLSNVQNVKSKSKVAKPNETRFSNHERRLISEISGEELQEPNETDEIMAEIITSNPGNGDVDTNTDLANHKYQHLNNTQIKLAQEQAVLAKIEQDHQRRMEDRKTKEGQVLKQKHDVQGSRKMEIAKKAEEVAGVIENGINRTKQREQKFDEWMDKLD